MYYFEKFRQYRLYSALLKTITAGKNNERGRELHETEHREDREENTLLISLLADEGQDPLQTSSSSSSSLLPSSSDSSLHLLESFELEAKQEVYPGTIYDGIEKVIQVDGHRERQRKRERDTKVDRHRGREREKETQR